MLEMNLQYFQPAVTMTEWWYPHTKWPRCLSTNFDNHLVKFQSEKVLKVLRHISLEPVSSTNVSLWGSITSIPVHSNPKKEHLVCQCSNQCRGFRAEKRSSPPATPCWNHTWNRHKKSSVVLRHFKFVHDTDFKKLNDVYSHWFCWLISLLFWSCLGWDRLLHLISILRSTKIVKEVKKLRCTEVKGFCFMSDCYWRFLLLKEFEMDKVT